MGIARRHLRWNGWGWAAHRDARATREDFWRWLADEMGMPALLATPSRPLEGLSLPIPRLRPAQIAAFAAITGADRVHQDDHERAFHARGRSYADLLRLRDGDLSSAPDAVIYPRGEEEVAAILKRAAAEKIPVLAFGGGTNGDSGAGSGSGAITLDLSQMDQLIALDTLSGIAIAEAGISGAKLARALAVDNFRFDPLDQDREFSTLGGWIAHRGAGRQETHETDGLISARLATASGVWAFGGSSGGQDLRGLLLGSQGTLGIITQASLRLQRMRPLLRRVYLFGDFAHGHAALREAAQSGLALCDLHLFDAGETYARRALGTSENSFGLRARLAQFAFTGPHIEGGSAIFSAAFGEGDDARQFASVAESFGARPLDAAVAEPFADGGKNIPYLRDLLLDRGVGLEILDAWVRWSVLPALYTAAKTALEEAMRDSAPLPGAHGMVLCHLGRASSDGAHLTFICLFPRNLDAEIAQAGWVRRAGEEAFAAHDAAQPQGDGALRAGKSALADAARRALKAVFDPDGILNPGKSLA